MTARWMAAAVLAAAVPAAAAGVPAGLEGGQELYRGNNWMAARAHLKAAAPRLTPKDALVAGFIVGRSHAREAELYEAVHWMTARVGLDYLDELGSVKENRKSPWIPLFRGFYQLDTGAYAAADKTLTAAVAPTLAAAWRATASVRRSAAQQRLGRPGAAAPRGPVTAEADFETLYWQVAADASKAAKAELGKPATPRARLAAAAVLYRAGKAAEAELLLQGLDLDAPDVEELPDPKKILRYHDAFPLLALARVSRERAAAALIPVARSGASPEAGLAAFHAGVALSRLGVNDEAPALLILAGSNPATADHAPVMKVLAAAAGWKTPPPEAALLPLWQETQGNPDAVLTWADLALQTGPARAIASKVTAALKELPKDLDPKANAPRLGRWGLSSLKAGADARAVLEVLEAARDKANKNKIEANDPVLLLAICAARSDLQDYAQALETLYELGKTFPGLRGLQWNMQGLYAARQKAGGDARISQ